MQRMLQELEIFSKESNVTFSTDPVPAKSKTKCIYVTGNKRNLAKSLKIHSNSELRTSMGRVCGNWEETRPSRCTLGCSEKSKSVIKKKEHTYFGVVGYTNKEFQVKI